MENFTVCAKVLEITKVDHEKKNLDAFLFYGPCLLCGGGDTQYNFSFKKVKITPEESIVISEKYPTLFLLWLKQQFIENDFAFLDNIDTIYGINTCCFCFTIILHMINADIDYQQSLFTRIIPSKTKNEEESTLVYSLKYTD